MAANGDSGSGGALSPGPVPGSAPIPGRSGGPEKTVGGFEKKDLKNGDKDKDKGDKEKGEPEFALSPKAGGVGTLT